MIAEKLELEDRISLSVDEIIMNLDGNQMWIGTILIWDQMNY